MHSHPSDEKLALALRFLNENERSVFVHLRTDAADLIIPDFLKSQKTIVLQFGKDMPIPIVDLDVSRLGISGGLSFSRVKYFCRVPWLAVYALANERGMGQIWESDAPVAFVGAVQPKLEVVKGGALLTTPARGVLKLVK